MDFLWYFWSGASSIRHAFKAGTKKLTDAQTHVPPSRFVFSRSSTREQERCVLRAVLGATP